MRLFKITYLLSTDLSVLLEEDRDVNFLSFAQQVKNIQIEGVLYFVTKTIFMPSINELFIYLQE